MSKLLKKLIGLSLVAFSLMSIFNTSVFAEGEAAPADFSGFYQALRDVPSCIKLPTEDEINNTPEEGIPAMNAKYPAINYLITITEEPLESGLSADAAQEKIVEGDLFVPVKCYRNLFSWRNNNEEFRVSEPALGAKCSTNASALANNTDNMAKYNTYFVCKEVLVFLSKGGLSTLEAYIALIYRYISRIGGLVAVLIMIFNGVKIATAGGDSQAVANAKGKIIQSIAGLVVLFLSALILYTINPNFFVYS